MADDSLLLLANEVRGKTLRLLDAVAAEGDEAAARFAPEGLSNSILWHAGHALMVVEHLAIMPATGRAAGYPPAWFDKFSWKSNPSTVTDWPLLSEVIASLREQLTRLTAAIGSLSPQQLDQIVDPQRNRTLRYSILHGLHDEAGHQGEIWLLRKIQDRRATGASGAKS